jgi:L-threonylcarbamoyladenylate synthase
LKQILLDSTNEAEAVAEAATALRAGYLVALPTETVYGLAADAANGVGVARVFAAKGRPSFNPLICHVTGVAMARRYGALDSRAEALAAAFWPGPLTLVVPLLEGAPVHPLATSGLDSVALRAPRGIAGKIVAALDGAIAAPSANRSGRISPTLAQHVAAQLGDQVALLLDGGPCDVGVESTIVSLVGAARLLRPGGVPAEAIEALLGAPLERAAANEAVTAPGMLASHYAPHLPVRLEASHVEPSEALLDFGPDGVAGIGEAAAVRNLSPSGELVEAAANLFAYLAELDASGASGIAVAPVPAHGLGEAINDRLRRAAAPR